MKLASRYAAASRFTASGAKPTDMHFLGCRPRPLLKGFLHNPPEFESSTFHRERKAEVGGDQSPTPPN